MGHIAAAGSHAGGLYRKSFAWLGHRVRKAEAEAHHLHQVEQQGVSAETPFIAVLGLIFFLVPLAAVLMAIGFLAAHLFG